MKKQLALQHKSDYNITMDLLTTWLEKIQFDLVEVDNKKEISNGKSNWHDLIAHNKSYPRFSKTKLTNTPANNFSKLLSNRKTVRKFEPGYKIDLITISSIFSNLKDTSKTDFPRRSFPSGGALYPSNIYCIINNSLDFQKGLYFYNHKSNCLETVLQKDLRKDIKKAISDKNISTAPLVFILTSSYYKSCLKYGSRGFLYSMIEIGALAQTINLSCNNENLDCVWLGGFADKVVQEILDINAELEIELPILIIAAGKAKRVNANE